MLRLGSAYDLTTVNLTQHLTPAVIAAKAKARRDAEEKTAARVRGAHARAGRRSRNRAGGNQLAAAGSGGRRPPCPSTARRAS